MKLNPLTGRLGNHRFHPMLVHFPSGLYPFSLVMNLFFWFTNTEAYATAGTYALYGAVGSSILALIYGVIDFLQLDPKSKAWKIAGIHALLNSMWFVIYTALLFYNVKHGFASVGLPYLITMTLTTCGLIVSNFLGAELIIKYHTGIQPNKE